MNRIRGSDRVKPTMVLKMAINVMKTIFCRRMAFARSRSCMPLAREITAVAPVFRAMIRFMNKNRGWLARLTALMACGPRPPTIMVSTMDTRLVRNSSQRDGQAIWVISRYSSRDVMVSGRTFLSFLDFRYSSSRVSSVPHSSLSRVMGFVFRFCCISCFSCFSCSMRCVHLFSVLHSIK